MTPARCSSWLNCSGWSPVLAEVKKKKKQIKDKSGIEMQRKQMKSTELFIKGRLKMSAADFSLRSLWDDPDNLQDDIRHYITKQEFKTKFHRFFVSEMVGSVAETYLLVRIIPLIPVLPPHPAPSEPLTENPTLTEALTGTSTPLNNKPCANSAKQQN